MQQVHHHLLIDPKARDEQFRFRLVRFISAWLGGMIAVTLFIRTVFFPSKPFTTVIPLAVALALLLVPRLARTTKSVRRVGYLLIGSLALVGLFTGFGNGGVQAPATHLFIIMPLIGFLALGKKGGKVALGMALFFPVLLLLAGKKGWVLPMDQGVENYRALVLCAGAMVNYMIGAVYESSRRRTETMLLELSQQLASSSKFSSLGEMAGGIAHEINNPLAIILGKSRQLRRNIEAGSIDSRKILQDLGKIEATAERIAKIVHGLRSISRHSEGDPMEAVPVSRIVDDLLGLCQERFKSQGIELRVKIERDAAIECRPSQILQVILNLLNNSYDAVESLPEKWVELSVSVAGQWIQFAVTDSGNGIPPNVVQNLMQPFFTTKEVGKGTGIGLSISRGIAQQHRGLLKYDSSSKNTRFLLELPFKELSAIRL